jgi:hypothetical protein
MKDTKGKESRENQVRKSEKGKSSKEFEEKAKEHTAEAMRGVRASRATAHTAQRHGQRTNVTWLSFLQAALMSVNGRYFYSYHYCIILRTMVSRPYVTRYARSESVTLFSRSITA